MAEQSAVTAIMVTYNSAAVVEACITALREAGTQVLVVDNASADRSVALAQAAGAEVIVNPRNEGFGRANNIGVAAAQSDYVLLINPDAVISAEALAALLRRAEGGSGLYAPVLVEPDGQESGWRDGLLGTYLSGACLLVKRQEFLDMGGFDPHIFLFYEDDDICRRFRDAGLGITLVEDARVTHALGGSSGGKRSGRSQYIVRYHQAWSRFYVADKYGVPVGRGGWLARFACKYLFAMLTGNAMKKARYSGSLMGAYDYGRGRAAIDGQKIAAVSS